MRILSKSNRNSYNEDSDFEQEQNEKRYGDIRILGFKSNSNNSTTSSIPVVASESELRSRFARLFGKKPVATANHENGSRNNGSNYNDSWATITSNSVSMVSKTPTTTPYVKKTRKPPKPEVENRKVTSNQEEIPEHEIDLLLFEELSNGSTSAKNALTIDSKPKKIPRDEKNLDRDIEILKKKKAHSLFSDLISDLDTPDIPTIPSYDTNKSKNSTNPNDSVVGPIINYEDDDDDKDVDSLVRQFQDEVKLEMQYEQSKKDIDKELLDRYKLLKVGIGGGTPINDSDKKVAELGPPPIPIDPTEFGYCLNDDPSICNDDATYKCHDCFDDLFCERSSEQIRGQRYEKTSLREIQRKQATTRIKH
ncbi:10060_t:CDS:2 [Ambispora gerdemannii]|uniref:10060_t:CDS:1 n=1 Tax=Ambispora gerdemannii TaxID=144530 RepID=A0A9N9GB34_9GLOM|nr:10060_t:CDS:2 [Ambispora gerdemannii]